MLNFCINAYAEPTRKESPTTVESKFTESVAKCISIAIRIPFLRTELRMKTSKMLYHGSIFLGTDRTCLNLGNSFVMLYLPLIP